MQRSATNPTAMMDINLFEHCSPGADVQAVLYRVGMLRMLARLELLSPWLRDGELANAVFKVAAVFPMKRLSVGIRPEGLPFDAQGFLAEIERENNQ